MARGRIGRIRYGWTLEAKISQSFPPIIPRFPIGISVYHLSTLSSPPINVYFQFLQNTATLHRTCSIAIYLSTTYVSMYLLPTKFPNLCYYHRNCWLSTHSQHYNLPTEWYHAMSHSAFSDGTVSGELLDTWYTDPATAQKFGVRHLDLQTMHHVRNQNMSGSSLHQQTTDAQYWHAGFHAFRASCQVAS